MTTRRQIIQIAVDAHVMYALCNDGTIWAMVLDKRNDDPRWLLMPWSIPQEAV